LLEITATILVQIPSNVHQGQENILLVPSGRNRRPKDIMDERPQLALALGCDVGSGISRRRLIEVEIYH
jgi:hypothetical protein